jgi:hypothetical protein
LETFITAFNGLASTINGFYSVLGKGDDDSRRDESIQVRPRPTDIRYFKNEKALGNAKVWRKFVESCKNISKCIKLSQKEIEHQSILDYLNYTELVNEEIEAHNKALEPKK